MREELANIVIIGIGAVGEAVAGKVSGLHQETAGITVVAGIAGIDLKQAGEADLVLAVADPRDSIGILRGFCSAAREHFVKLFLIVPDTVPDLPEAGILKKLHGLVVVSTSALAGSTLWSTALSHEALFEYLLLHVVEKLTALATQASFISVDLADIQNCLMGGVTRIGTGMAAGAEKGVIAVEQALECLKRQGVTSSDAGAVLCIVSGGRELGMDDFDRAHRHLLSKSDEDADVITGIVYDESLGDNFMATVLVKKSFFNSRNRKAGEGINGWITLPGDEMRAIPAFERKRWFGGK